MFGASECLSRRNASPLCCSISMEDLSVLNHNYDGSVLLHTTQPGKLSPSILAQNLLLHNRSYSDTVFDMPVHSETRLDVLRKLLGEDQENIVDDDTIFPIEINNPTTLLDEIMAKYGCEQGFYSPNSQNVIFGKTSPAKQLPGKRGVSGCLELLVLNERGISCTGGIHKLRPIVEHVTELDLAKNRISDWKEILCALSVMPKVYHCNLSLNPLTNAYVPLSDTLPNMSRLVLNATQIKWSALTTLLNHMPNLEELHLSLNSWCSDTVPKLDVVYPSVGVLHISLCDIDKWDTLSAICSLFPRMYTLTAADNPIDSLDSDVTCLSLIRRLNFNRCAFNDWNTLQTLATLPNLNDLRLTAVPLLSDMNEDERRMHVLSRMPQLTSFNGSTITEGVRIDAERSFIRYCTANQINHVVLKDLELKHGDVSPLVEVNLAPKNEITVEVVFEDRRFPLVINLKHTIGQLKKCLCGLVGLNFNQFDVFHADKEIEEEVGMFKLQYNRISLHSLRINDADELHIMRKLSHQDRQKL